MRAATGGGGVAAGLRTAAGFAGAGRGGGGGTGSVTEACSGGSGASSLPLKYDSSTSPYPLAANREKNVGWTPLAAKTPRTRPSASLPVCW